MKTTLAVIAFMLLGVRIATADKDKADSLFRQGKRLMSEKRYADACESFEHSFRLDPGIGAELNVAKCYEEWGKLATAYRAFKKAEDLAKDAHDSRVGKIHELVEQLDLQVPKLTIHVAKDADADSLKVWMDGATVERARLNEPQMVDPGPHLVEYQAGDEKKKSKLIPIERGGSSDVTLDLPSKKLVVSNTIDKQHAAPHTSEKAGTRPLLDPGRTQRIAGIATGGLGIVMIGISSVMTLSARGSYNDALAMHCGGMTNGCDAQGLIDTADARHSANIATVVFVIGAFAIGGGAALYFTAPHATKVRSDDDEHALYLAPSLSPHGGGVVFGGTL